ncbi:unnamed protein product [Somion occarium]|uniref:UBC core domain-containing protein n=1 Tax=Somion occarium TaxID=3059160 RepID=A0ABP1CZ35_9APHY
MSNLSVQEEPRERRPSMTNHASEPPLTANQFVDNELLRGVSLGFNSPSISGALSPMQGPIPNVVALPYGKCPPFHVKAPSWRDLIKLMARLSGTRLEPTIEAMAVVKTDMKIRIVVNFVKVHQSSSDWHVILYMTIDYPVPANHPYAYKYRNGDPNVLPYSYSLSPMPAFLRDGADAPMSKWYNIPATQSNPLRKLPITFPDLAAYLITVLSESRVAVHDSSSGLRRLAKLIDTSYPSENTQGDEDERERRGLFDRLLKRSHRQSRDRNADTYDVVTPFYADEFGA